ncbi:uncharacterized protein BP01DRAFT_131089 [Aspergillus saccharolyticus JOP 1030-1]|uniref:Uncharacterized protein n=1 Tax=Aspergillus saccharolyticus JOP 1030-1 TaxID=1450539 RepID=A0A318Z854_9EURO|nr:hypothetical protein BP01DRAFT_131089 [Aspergillus saccharolyticus JOP 1030-1]PYH42597.1 hypothetical protein BP01DRAFT_131089 [Aspergillus saccharolyticus JOP 1030-1]
MGAGTLLKIAQLNSVASISAHMRYGICTYKTGSVSCSARMSSYLFSCASLHLPLHTNVSFFSTNMIQASWCFFLHSKRAFRRCTSHKHSNYLGILFLWKMYLILVVSFSC